MPQPPKVSIIIPSLGRGQALEECLQSIRAQNFTDYEVILVTEEGELARLRNEGAKRSRGKYLVFIDDDVVTSPGWLEAIVKVFDTVENVAGVSGPAVIRETYRRNRDIFRFRLFKQLYDFAFLDGWESLPGHISRSGAWTTGACDEDCAYEGFVQFLEACNMAYRSDVFFHFGGFDTTYRGVGDWSEPDLAFRIRKAGYGLWFSGNARLEHRPSRSGAFKKRLSDSRNRMANYELFSRRWVRPSWRHNLYKQFLRIYYALASIK